VRTSYLIGGGPSELRIAMALARPFWKGYLKLSLVSCPIAMFPASSSSERVSFRQINKKTGHRLKQQLVDSETSEVVESADKGRGYEIGRNQYLPVEDEELEALRLESTHTIDIEKFVPRSEIDERYLDSPYYLAPTDNVGQDAFAVIREAMKRKNMVGLGRAVISRRERIVMLEPFDKGLMATTLRYAYEVRDTSEYFDDIPSIKVPGEMIELAEHILDTKAGHFDPAEFEDRYETAVVEMLKRKQAGLPPEAQPEAAPPTNVVNLMDALRRSIDAEKPAAARGKAADRKKPAKEAERRTGKARKAG
jgi:DNA end-binding protein Ku